MWPLGLWIDLKLTAYLKGVLQDPDISCTIAFKIVTLVLSFILMF